MTRYYAGWIVPVATPPIRNGWVDVAEGRVVGVGGSDEMTERSGSTSTTVVDLGQVALLPGLVNAHTHLELSALRGAVPPAASMPEWVQWLLRARESSRHDDVGSAIRAALEEAHRTGTALVGDVSNTLASIEPLTRSRLGGIVSYELIKFNVDDPSQLVTDALARIDAVSNDHVVRVTLGAHAPYSVGPALLREIAHALDARALPPASVHVAESVEEVRFLRDGEGPWQALLRELGAWDERWQPPDCGPVEYLRRAGWLDRPTLAVHGVQCTDEELDLLAEVEATLVTCPRSNEWTGAGTPPVKNFYASGGRIAIGTDSLASVLDLNMFAEIAEVRRLAPLVPARRVLESATRIGAQALGFGETHGTIEAGRTAALIVVRLPAAVADVEEYLVGGVDARDVQWLHELQERDDRRGAVDPDPGQDA